MKPSSKPRSPDTSLCVCRVYTPSRPETAVRKASSAFPSTPGFLASDCLRIPSYVDGIFPKLERGVSSQVKISSACLVYCAAFTVLLCGGIPLSLRSIYPKTPIFSPSFRPPQKELAASTVPESAYLSRTKIPREGKADICLCMASLAVFKSDRPTPPSPPQNQPPFRARPVPKMLLPWVLRRDVM